MTSVNGKPHQKHSLFSYFKIMLYFLKKFPLMLSVSLITTIILIIWECGIPLVLEWLFDIALPQKNQALLTNTLIGVGVFYIIVVISKLVEIHNSTRLGSQVTTLIRFRMFHKLQNLDLLGKKQYQSATLMKSFISYLNIMDRINIVDFWQVVYTVLTSFVSLSLLFYINPFLSFLTLCILPLPLYLTYYYSLNSVNQWEEVDKLENNTLGSFRNAMSSNQFANNTFAKIFFSHRFKNTLKQLIQINFKFNCFLGLSLNISTLFFYFLQLLIISCGSYLVILGYLTSGKLVGFFLLFGNSIKAIEKFISLYPLLLKDHFSLLQIYNFIHTKSQSPINNLIEAPRFDDKIIFNKLSLTIKNRLLLNDITCEFHHSKSYAIVIDSESTKKLIYQLLIKEIRPSFGNIYFDNIDYQNLSSKSLKHQIKFVGPKPKIFDISIIDNIRLGKLNASEREIIELAQFLGMHDAIIQLPKQYHTLIGIHDTFLSENQLQLICIARALISKPSILFLDDATSQFEPFLRNEIDHKLQSLASKMTIISTSHSLYSISKADHIFVLEKGGLVESGNHQELLKNNGLYHKLWHKQQGFLLDDANKEISVIPGWLKNIPLFYSLNQDKLEQLATEFTIQTNSSNEIVIKQNCPAEKFYIIVAGAVEVFTQRKDGSKQILAKLSDGDYFGEIGLLFDTLTNAFVKTKANTVFLTLHFQQFRVFFKNLPQRLQQELLETALQHFNLQQKKQRLKVRYEI